ncbi:MAG: hypothetical protein R2822_17860 [Spirosomataceae bacterium]
MAVKKEETASFVLRFTQKIFNNDAGEPEIQWRGHIRHVQDGEEKRFSDMDTFVQFVQHKLSEMTAQAVEDKSPEEQKGILSKSFEIWKKVATNTPKMVLESIKDPKKQIAQIQDQIQDQIHQVSEAINQKIEDKIGRNLEADDWLSSTKSDYKNMMTLLESMNKQIQTLNKKIDKLSKKSEK